MHDETPYDWSKDRFMIWAVSTLLGFLVVGFVLTMMLIHGWSGSRPAFVFPAALVGCGLGAAVWVLVVSPAANMPRRER
jgi:hypothetical protein